MEKLIANLKHWQTTAIGILVTASAILQNGGVQQLAQVSPKVAGYLSIAGTAVATALLILGAGPSGGAVSTTTK